MITKKKLLLFTIVFLLAFVLIYWVWERNTHDECMSYNIKEIISIKKKIHELSSGKIKCIDDIDNNSIYGCYAAAPSLPTLSGINIDLRSNHTFVIEHYSDISSSSLIKGQWTLTNGVLLLYKRSINPFVKSQQINAYIWINVYFDAENNNDLGACQSRLLSFNDFNAAVESLAHDESADRSEEFISYIDAFALIKRNSRGRPE